MTSKIGNFDTFNKKNNISAIMTPIMAFLALAYYLTSIGNPTRNLLKPFSKSEKYVIWRYDVIMM